jgi:hypothetical protein
VGVVGAFRPHTHLVNSADVCWSDK